MSVTARYILRATLVGVAAAAGSLQAVLPGVTGSDIVQTVIAGVIAMAAYAGVGAAVPQVEPKIGNKLTNS